MPDVARVFVEHEDDAFAAKFAGLVKLAYAGLFESFGEAAWSLERAKLIGFFRVEDESSATVGDRQAATFQALAGLAGHGVPVAPPGAQTAPRRREPASGRSRPASSKESRASLRASATSASTESDHTREEHGQLDAATAAMSLTLRIEINLPIADDQVVYDRIFKSIRANLINE